MHLGGEPIDMSRNINVNPGQYKTAGRERQGESIVHEVEKQKASLMKQKPRPKQAKQRTAQRQQTAPSKPSPSKPSRAAVALRGQVSRAGISNRMPAGKEAKDRAKHPPVDTSHKAGSRSVAQKEANARYPDRSMPPSRKVAGAFGREPKGRVRRGRQP
jgi:hypothetical protein